MKKTLGTALGCMVMLIGCQQAEEIKLMNENLGMSIEASIGRSDVVAGRYVGDSPNEVQFANNDAIGLSVNDGSFVKWTFNGSTWDSGDVAVRWEDKETDHVFCAFYPYAGDASLGSVEMPDLTKQTGEMTDLGSFDFLYATKTQNYGNDGVVSFSDDNSFEHVFSLLTIKLKGEGDLLASTIKNISINGTNIATPYTFSFSDSEVSVTSDGDEGIDSLEVNVNYTMTSTGKTFYFVVNPETVALANVSLSIQYEDKNSNTHVATLEGLGNAENTKFQSGKEYSYAIKVQSGVLEISGNTITDWDTAVDMDDIIINGVEF